MEMTETEIDNPKILYEKLCKATVKYTFPLFSMENMGISTTKSIDLPDKVALGNSPTKCADAVALDHKLNSIESCGPNKSIATFKNCDTSLSENIFMEKDTMTNCNQMSEKTTIESRVPTYATSLNSKSIHNLSDSSEDDNNDVYEFNDTPDDEDSLAMINRSSSSSNIKKAKSRENDLETPNEHTGIEQTSNLSPEIIGTNENISTKIHFIRERKDVPGEEENCWQVKEKKHSSGSKNIDCQNSLNESSIDSSAIVNTNNLVRVNNGNYKEKDTEMFDDNSSIQANDRKKETTCENNEEVGNDLTLDRNSTGSSGIVPLNTNKFAHQCPLCNLWKLKTAYEEHVKQCQATNNIQLTSLQKQSQAQRSKKGVVPASNILKPMNFAKKNSVITAKAMKAKVPKHKKKEQLVIPKRVTCGPKKKGGIPNVKVAQQANTYIADDSMIKNNESRSFSWSFEKDVIEFFQSVRNSSTGFDVTLACWDDQTSTTATSQAHRIILSSASPVLRTILYVTSLKQKNNSFVYLNGVSHRDIGYILNFIYTGNAQVPLQHLSSFMAAARLLKIKGINDSSNIDHAG